MKITGRHRELIELLADVADTRNWRVKAKAAGVSKSTMYRMLRDTEAVKLLRERTDYYIGLNRAAAYRCLVTNFESGDRASARDYLTAIGDIGSGGHMTHVNVEQHNTGCDEETLEDCVRRVSGERWDRVVSKDEG